MNLLKKVNLTTLIPPRYVPKLAAAVRAWLAVKNPTGKSPKQALEDWLRGNAADLRLKKKTAN